MHCAVVAFVEVSRMLFMSVVWQLRDRELIFSCNDAYTIGMSIVIVCSAVSQQTDHSIY
jgi:hypothetical protein